MLPGHHSKHEGCVASLDRRGEAVVPGHSCAVVVCPSFLALWSHGWSKMQFSVFLDKPIALLSHCCVINFFFFFASDRSHF